MNVLRSCIITLCNLGNDKVKSLKLLYNNKGYSYLVKSIIRYPKGNVLRSGTITLCNLGKDKVKSLKLQ